MRSARSQPAHGAVRTSDPPLQGLRVDRDAALSLAVFVLSESRDGPGQRLDERDLSALGRGARRDDRDAGLLVPGAERAQADDRPARLRRRRQSRSDDHRTARIRPRRRLSSSPGGRIRVTWPGAGSRSSFTATPSVPKRCAVRFPTGCRTCTWYPLATAPRSIDTSGTTSRTRRVTLRWMTTRPSRGRFARRRRS